MARKEMRNNNRQLDAVCLDCMDNLNHTCVNCEKDCPVGRLKKINNKILNDRFKKEMKED